jgi:3',5'-cyclic AMP phosphodiesterase CpdA
MKKLYNRFLIIILTGFIYTNNSKCQEFSFAFLTDMHLSMNNDKGFEGFRKAITHAMLNQVDFIITGGDNVDIDVLGDKKNSAESLYKKYKSELDKADINIYPTIGNHDRFMGKDNPGLFNDGLFKKYFTHAYYSFDYKNWHFIVLNSTQICEGDYCVDKDQLTWLKNDLTNVSAATPIAISTHVPFLSVYYPVTEGKYVSTDTFTNFKEVWDLFKDHNLKLVLQGHMHLYEEIKVKNVQFITAGAVSASWWGGPYYGTEEGYLLINIEGNDFTWQYVDYGWEAEASQPN